MTKQVDGNRCFPKDYPRAPYSTERPFKIELGGLMRVAPMAHMWCRCDSRFDHTLPRSG